VVSVPWIDFLRLLHFGVEMPFGIKMLRKTDVHTHVAA